MKKQILVLCVVLTCIAFTTDVQKRMVRENGYDIECYISTKKLNNYSSDKTYYWFKSGGVHQSLANAGGNVLHDSYLKYYRSNQLAEQGAFDYGLKTGIWKYWDENGQLLLLEHWHNGYKQGKCITYSTNGDMVLAGTYRHNIKVGRWINYKTKDTTYHAKDTIYTEKPKLMLLSILRKKDSIEKAEIKFNRIAKRKFDSIEKVKIKQERIVKKRNDSIERAKNKQERLTKKRLDSIEKARGNKKSFIKRLFKKKG
ncbi:toxin-antitoxin system YwqK family antitoxin [Hyunsoonleella ulvae]|uniref:toxin-antitoxin system YwqK family antitoxin n=1 Tax=Hyunsoonleella ulvae TaxID=2799948 RepID=UPI0019397284|nr:hypothetical protein [Hyunsoonleella ulvae]